MSVTEGPHAIREQRDARADGQHGEGEQMHSPDKQEKQQRQKQ